jgi:hypothetical protein
MPSSAYASLAFRLDQRDFAAAPEMLALAAAGDADAQNKSGELCLRGIGGPVDLNQANRWIAKAAAQGQPDALRTAAYFTGAGIGRSPDPAKALTMLQGLAPSDRLVAVQLAFLGHVQCEAKLATTERRLISDDPHIELVVRPLARRVPLPAIARPAVAQAGDKLCRHRRGHARPAPRQ